jgi:hypothetical protein
MLSAPYKSFPGEVQREYAIDRNFAIGGAMATLTLMESATSTLVIARTSVLLDRVETHTTMYPYRIDQCHASVDVTGRMHRTPCIAIVNRILGVSAERSMFGITNCYRADLEWMCAESGSAPAVKMCIPAASFSTTIVIDDGKNGNQGMTLGFSIRAAARGSVEQLRDLWRMEWK